MSKSYKFEKIDKIVELDIKTETLDEIFGTGVDVVSFVDQPAIEIEFEYFAKQEFIEPKEGELESEFIPRCMSELAGEYPNQDQRLAVCYSYLKEDQFDLEGACWEGYEPIGVKELDGRMVPNCVPVETSQQFESYNDYPQTIKDNARRGIELNEAIGNKCATQVGKVRAQQLANGEKISFDTIKRMYSYLSRAAEFYNPEDKEACGTISYLLWGGEEALKWSQRKIKEVEQEITLRWAEEYGELITENCTVIQQNQEFSTVGDIASAIQGLDILSTLGIRRDEPAETKYRYTGPSAERGFCRAMLRLNKMYSEQDMFALEDKLGVVNPGMGPGGIDTYDVFAYKGGVSCRHYWTKLAVFRNPEGRVLVIDQGPAAGNAGKSNNGAAPSPSGSVGNNASLTKDFGFSSIDEEKRLVAGPLMVPNTMILRKDERGNPYYVYFSKATIKRIQEKFNKYSKQNRTDNQHDGNVTENNTMLEQWIIEHPTWDKSRFYGFDLLPLGTWFAVYKVNDDKTWNAIKSGKLKGFSVAGNFIEQAKEVQQDEETLASIIDIIKRIK